MPHDGSNVNNLYIGVPIKPGLPLPSVCRSIGYNIRGTVAEIMCEDYFSQLPTAPGAPVELFEKMGAVDFASGRKASAIIVGVKASEAKHKKAAF